MGCGGRSVTHRHRLPLGWGPKGRWFSSSRPDSIPLGVDRSIKRSRAGLNAVSVSLGVLGATAVIQAAIYVATGTSLFSPT